MPVRFDDDFWAERLVLQVLSEALRIDPGSIHSWDRLDELVGDSLDVVEIVMHLEELGVSLRDGDLSGIKTVQDLIDAVKRGGDGPHPGT